MFDIASTELLLIVVVAVLVIGPKELPRALYKLGQYLGKARAMTRHFRSGLDEMVRQVELEEMEKKWAAENARIMAQSAPAEALPAPVEPQDIPPADGTAAVETDGDMGPVTPAPRHEGGPA